jgi:hypothetical protein
MRPRSFDDASALEAGMEDLLRRPDPLTDPAAAAAPSVAVAAAAGIVETFLVAGPNSAPASLAAADFVTDEAADQTEFTAALNAYAYNPPISGINTGPRVVIAAGLYKLDGTVTMTTASALVGVGRGTQLEMLTTAAEIVVTNYCEVGDFIVEFGPGP